LRKVVTKGDRTKGKANVTRIHYCKIRGECEEFLLEEWLQEIHARKTSSVGLIAKKCQNAILIELNLDKMVVA
jgi:hypothetical protein